MNLSDQLGYRYQDIFKTIADNCLHISFHVAIMQDHTNSHSRFPETRWTLLGRVGSDSDDETERTAALSDICAIYWPPIYAYIRSQGKSSHDAEDLTQEFLYQFVQGEQFSRADQNKGRLRSYLLAAVKNFLITEHRKASRQKRGSGVLPLSLDVGQGESRCLQIASSSDCEPDHIFDRQWATTLMSHVMDQLKSRYHKRDQAELFTKLSQYLRVEPRGESLQKLASELGQTDGALRVALHRLRQRFKTILHNEVRVTLAPGDDFEEEMRHLRSVI